MEPDKPSTTTKETSSNLQNGVIEEQRDSSARNNPTVPEDLNEDLEKIKGDMIGDTVYSERWVLKTLMSVTEKYPEYCGDEVKELDSSLEEDVCTIWDMAAEHDVALFLIEHHILDIIEAIVSQCQNPRLMEIMIGVLGNLACQPEVRSDLSQRGSLVYTLVSHLRYPDTLALVQLVRLIRTCLWELRSSAPSTDNFWITALSKQEAYQSLGFIIGSSVEEDLLTAAFQLMETLVYIKLPDNQGYLGKYYSSPGMVGSMIEGLQELTKDGDGEDLSMSSRKIEETCQHWVSVLHGITFCEEGQLAIREHAVNILKLLEFILRNFLDQDNWKEALEEHSDFLMCGANILCLLLPTDFSSECLACVVTLLERVQGLGEITLQESLENCVATVAAAEGVQTQMLATLDQCHAPEVELCFLAIEKQDKALLSQLLAELKCTNKHPRLCEIANKLVLQYGEQSRK